jgi:hypothetical protein
VVVRERALTFYFRFVVTHYASMRWQLGTQQEIFFFLVPESYFFKDLEVGNHCLPFGDYILCLGFRDVECSKGRCKPRNVILDTNTDICIYRGTRLTTILSYLLPSPYGTYDTYPPNTTALATHVASDVTLVNSLFSEPSGLSGGSDEPTMLQLPSS